MKKYNHKKKNLLDACGIKNIFFEKFKDIHKRAVTEDAISKLIESYENELLSDPELFRVFIVLGITHVMSIYNSYMSKKFSSKQHVKTFDNGGIPY